MLATEHFGLDLGEVVRQVANGVRNHSLGMGLLRVFLILIAGAPLFTRWTNRVERKIKTRCAQPEHSAAEQREQCDQYRSES